MNERKVQVFFKKLKDEENVQVRKVFLQNLMEEEENVQVRECLCKLWRMTLFLYRKKYGLYPLDKNFTH